MAIEFEKIKSWDGQSGTGADNRGVIDRNFEKVETELENVDLRFEDVEDEIVQLGGDLSEYAKKEETLDKLIKGWVIAEAMAISNPTYSTDGNISGAVITWGDGDVGSMSNVVVGQHGITSIRYSRSNGDYATMSVAYDSKGEFQSQEVIITKI